MEEVASIGGITSRQVANNYNKEHKHVMECIRNIVKRNPELECHFILNLYLSDRGRSYPEYKIDNIGEEILNCKFIFNTRNARFEYKIYNELKDYFSKLQYKIINQYSVCDNKYRIDFYIPKLNLAIEYDEQSHKYKKHEDINREIEIHNEIGCKFIRIKEDMSVGEALGLISKCILKAA